MKLICLLLLSSIWLMNSAKANDTRLTRNTVRTFRANADVDLNIENKYGKIIINTWDKNTVKIEANITAYGKNDNVVEKLLDRVEIDFTDTESYIKAQTVLDRKSSVLKEIWNTIADQAKVVLDNSRIRIDYEIHAPKQAKIKIDNKFGDVFLGEIDGRCKIDLAHGNFRAEVVKSALNLKMNFGNATIKKAQELHLDLQVAEVDLGEITVAEINSTGSEISFKKIDELQLNSRNDKIRIDQLGRLSGTSIFSKFDVATFLQDMELKITFGYMDIQKISPTFGQVRLEAKSADINLDLDANCHTYWEVTAKEDRVILPNQFKITSQSYQESSKLITKSGKYGSQGKVASHLTISASSGDIKIGIN